MLARRRARPHPYGLRGSPRGTCGRPLTAVEAGKRPHRPGRRDRTRGSRPRGPHRAILAASLPLDSAIAVVERRVTWIERTPPRRSDGDRAPAAL